MSREFFHCPHCGATEFSGVVKAFVNVEFTVGFGAKKNPVWEQSSAEPSWQQEVEELVCAKCEKSLKQDQLLTAEDWFKKNEPERIKNKPW